MSEKSTTVYFSLRAFLVAGLHVLAFAPLARTVNFDWPSLAVVCVAYFISFGFALHGIESLFYFENQVVSARSWIGGTLAFSVIGLLTSLLVYRSIESPLGLFESLQSWATMHAEQGRHTWWMRLGYAAIAFMVTYCVVGSATWPFVQKFYENSENGLALRVPSGRVVISLQLARGLVATVLILPLISGRGSAATDLTTWGYLFLTLSMTFAIAPMLTAPADWPRRLRFIHGIEIVIFCLIQSFAWWWLLT